uniref:Uncharacterized protein n=1 Tax=Quercus lobata TaxID=97700 RepID=A0A7N2MLX8_QUELO
MSNKQRSVKLFCTLVSKAVWEEQRLDLGSITRTFGLDPSTLKLNGHFISIGVDFIASSVTWNSLISFFSVRGFSTGKNHQDALIVDGKLTKLGSKRVCDPQDAVNGSYYVAADEVDGDSTRPQAEDFNLVKNKRLKERDTGGEALHGLSSKRKQLLEDVSLLKKLKINETESGTLTRHIFKEEEMTSQKPLYTPNLHAVYMSKNLMRMQGDETIEASPCKRMT